MFVVGGLIVLPAIEEAEAKNAILNRGIKDRKALLTAKAALATAVPTDDRNKGKLDEIKSRVNRQRGDGGINTKPYLSSLSFCDFTSYTNATNFPRCRFARQFSRC
jgi:hypothetical protein